ncbi:hypothetical protein MNBD_GAMMA01-943 [hydrothermal vent metagenome]|uniref:YknX-like beta-barrel domain-containing protein n=1 Tax=hydrothermal vent metagenome TaxID=652676 RepID=A0A3B0VNC2_9ZZZZ
MTTSNLNIKNMFIVGLVFTVATLLSTAQVSANPVINVAGELEALKTDGYTPPRVRGIWQYTIAFMAADGSTVKAGMPVLMFKVDAIQTKLINAKGELGIKQSELKNKKVNKVEDFEKKSIMIAEKKMEQDKASRKAALPQSLIAKNDYMENQLNYELAKKDYQSAKLDLSLAKQKAITEEQILNAEIHKLNAEITEYDQSIANMQMFAKSEGIVIHKSGWDKNKFAVGDTVWGGHRVIEVANLSEIIARLEISENNIKHIKLGQAVIIKLDSLPDRDFNGTIEKLAQVVKIKSKNQPSKILEAVVSIENIDTEVMRPGMRLSAEITTGATR